MKKIALIITVAILAGCSAHARQQQLAQEGRWEQVGLRDGRGGHYQKSAQELMQFGPVSDTALSEYRQGYRKGIIEFCQPEAAYKRGLNGTKYKGQCAEQGNESFIVKRWLDGMNQYHFNEAMSLISE